MCYNLAVTSQGKILTGLMERRALEAAFDALAEAADPTEMAQRARAVADFGDAALAGLLARLHTEDPKVRGGLGLVAQLLDRDLVVPALKAAVRARERSDQARVTALTLLDRYLHEPTDDGLLAAVQNPSGVARQSLRELIAAMDENPAALIEYLSQLAEQPADAPGLLMQAVPELLPHPHLIALLRMFAQGEDAALAQQAIELLGRTRTSEALQALISLMANLPPTRAAAAERSARKLRLSGVQIAPAVTPDRWQVFLSPIDGSGAQLIWFICRQPDTTPMALTILCQDGAGILAAGDADRRSVGELPPVVPEGEILSLPQPGLSRPLMLLSVPFDEGRRSVQQAVQQNWRNGQPPPLSYRFFSAQIWQYGPIQDIANPDVADESALMARHGDLTAALLDHPAFADWFWQAPAVAEAAERLGLRHARAARQQLIAELAANVFGAADAAGYQRRLRSMARWLELAREPTIAGLARAAAAQLATQPPAEILLVRRLIGLGLDVAALNLHVASDRRRTK